MKKEKPDSSLEEFKEYLEKLWGDSFSPSTYLVSLTRIKSEIKHNPDEDHPEVKLEILNNIVEYIEELISHQEQLDIVDKDVFHEGAKLNREIHQVSYAITAHQKNLERLQEVIAGSKSVVEIHYYFEPDESKILTIDSKESADEYVCKCSDLLESFIEYKEKLEENISHIHDFYLDNLLVDSPENVIRKIIERVISDDVSDLPTIKEFIENYLKTNDIIIEKVENKSELERNIFKAWHNEYPNEKRSLSTFHRWLPRS